MNRGGQRQHNDSNIDLRMDELINTPWGPIRSYSDLKRREKGFVITAVLFRLLAVGITVSRMAVLDRSSPDFVLCIILLINTALCIFYVLDAIFRERGSEMVVFLLALIMILIYVGITYGRERIEFALARFCLTLITCAILVIWGVIIIITIPQYHRSTSRIVFRVVGADATMQTMYSMFLWLQDLLKFDMHLKITMVGFIVAIPNNVETSDIVILDIGALLAIFAYVFGNFVFWMELKPQAITFFLHLPLVPIYCLYKMIQARNHLDSHSEMAICLMTCGAAIIILNVVIFTLGILVYRNFGKGLKDIILNRSDESSQLVNNTESRTSNHHM